MSPRPGTKRSGCAAVSEIRFKLDLKGLNELMKSPEMQGVLNDAAQKIAGAAGDGYEVESAHPIQFVAIASVRASTYDSYYDAMENRTLENAVGGVRI